MDERRITVAVDAMGGDYAPVEIVRGAILASQELDLDIILVGLENRLQKELGDLSSSRIRIAPASEVVEMGEEAARAIRTKKNSSIAVAARLCKEGKADALVSAGNTGAVMAAALLMLGRISGISRPAIAVVIPTPNKPVLLLDVGANVDSKAKNLLQFAHMGSAYAKKVLGVSEPVIGLLNVGKERGKGSGLIKKAHFLLEHSGLNFIGNLEGQDIPYAGADVVVCDGFAGNIVLKALEGMVDLVFSQLKTTFKKSLSSKFGALFLSPGLTSLKKHLDYEEYGGAQLLGVNGVCIISHGGSKAKAIKNAIRIAAQTVAANVVSEIVRDIKSPRLKTTSLA